MTMQRRRFLEVTVGATAAGMVIPGWIARAFGQDIPTHGESPVAPARAPTTSVATLSAAYREAQRLGKPLLVLVVPDEQSGESWSRARAFGELLNHGNDDAMIALSLTHVVCAKMSELRQLVPTAPAGEPMMVLVETDHVPAAVHGIDPRLVFDAPGGRSDDWDERIAREDRGVDQRLAQLTRELVNTVAPSAAVLTARAQLARSHASARVLAAANRAIVGGPRLDGPIADSVAAVIALAAQSAAPAVQRSLRQSLVNGAQARLRDARVPGSMWAVSGGCGTTIEGVQESIGVGCGMGSTPERSRRFLFFFTRVY